MPTKSRPPSEIISSIGTFATLVREGGDELSNRILRFQSHLSTMRGRVDAICFADHPDNNPDAPQTIELGLRFHKEAKDWVISWGTFVDGESHDAWKLLKDAPLKIKIAGIKMFPDLLEAMESSQETLVRKIASTVVEYDAFESMLNNDGKAVK